MKRYSATVALGCLFGSSYAIYGAGSLSAAGFDNVGMLSGASAAVIAPNWVLTAKHVGGVDFYLNGAHYVADARYDNPDGDISLLHFTKTFGSWYSPYYGDPTGQVLTYVGFGLTAEMRMPTDGSSYEFTGYHMLDGTGGTKRMMTNRAGGIVTWDYGWGPGWVQPCIVADLDYSTSNAPPSSRVDTLGDGGATANEGGLLYGDSGSPALLKVNGQWRVVGVNVDIEDRNGPNPGGSDNYLDFGDTMYSTWVGGYKGWMENTMAVPEPSAILLIGLGLGAVCRRRLKK